VGKMDVEEGEDGPRQLLSSDGRTVRTEELPPWRP
jgi:hypothetical protein